jgi:hypothetical protein
MKKIKQYAILNSKHFTLTEYFLSYDDFGKPFVTYSAEIIPLSECKNFVNPLTHFINLTYKYLHDYKNELCEVLENKSYDYMIEEFQKLY